MPPISASNSSSAASGDAGASWDGGFWQDNSFIVGGKGTAVAKEQAMGNVANNVPLYAALGLAGLMMVMMFRR